MKLDALPPELIYELDALPPELIYEIIGYLDTPKSLMNAMMVNVKFMNAAKFHLNKYLLCDGLRSIISKNRTDLLDMWKTYIFDDIPIGDVRRKIIVRAFFFLVGIHNISVDCRNVFHSHIIPSDYSNVIAVGYLFNERDSTSPLDLRVITNTLKRESSLYGNSLFESIVGIDNIVNNALKRINKASHP